MTTLIGLYSSTPGCGKSMVAQILKDQHQFEIHPFAGPLKKLTVSFVRQFGYSTGDAFDFVYRHKETPIGGIPGQPTARHLMQTLGTEWGRELVHRDVWVDMWHSTLPCLATASTVADDMRKTNEARAIKDAGGEWWRVVRPGHEGETNGHSSEGALDDLEFDRVIVNDGTLAELEVAVGRALDQSRGGARPTGSKVKEVLDASSIVCDS